MVHMDSMSQLVQSLTDSQICLSSDLSSNYGDWYDWTAERILAYFTNSKAAEWTVRMLAETLHEQPSSLCSWCLRKMFQLADRGVINRDQNIVLEDNSVWLSPLCGSSDIKDTQLIAVEKFNRTRQSETDVSHDMWQKTIKMKHLIWTSESVQAVNAFDLVINNDNALEKLQVR